MTPGSHRFDLWILPAVDSAATGTYEAWIHPAGGEPISIARFIASVDSAREGSVVVDFALPVENPARIAVTLEPPGDDDPEPSPYGVLAGAFRDGRARLSIEDGMTNGAPLVREPGAHSLFTSSNNNLDGYPSHENSGLWPFNIYPEKNPHETREVHVTPLRRSWLYEGWIVYQPRHTRRGVHLVRQVPAWPERAADLA